MSSRFLVAAALCLLMPRCACDEPASTTTTEDAGAAVDAAGPDDAGSVEVDAGACGNRVHEPDDTLDEARAQGAMTALSPSSPARVRGLHICAGEIDIVAAYSDCCVEVGADVRWNGGDNAVEVEMLDESGQPFTFDAMGDVFTRSATTVRMRKAESGGVFYVRVVGAESVDYEVAVFGMVFE